MQNNIDLENIITLLKQREERGFSLLYDHYSTTLLSVITFIVKDEVVSLDILQETFIKVWKNIDTYDADKGTLYTWMLNIARNMSIDHLRKQKRQASVKTTQVDQIADFFVEYTGIADIIALLEENLRIIIEAVYFQGYTHEQASILLDIPLGTIKSRLKIAIRELKKYFQVSN